MGRLIIRSFFEDIKNFRNMIPYRIKKIEEAKASPLPQTYGVNELAAAVHPDKQQVFISSVETIDSKTKILTLSSCNKPSLAPFRAGQGINITIDNETTFFPVLSATEKKGYRIIVKADSSDNVSRYLLNLTEDEVFDISGPTGLFYYSGLRDGDSVVLISDYSGVVPVLSICRYLSETTDVTAKVFIVVEKECFKNYNLFDDLSGSISVVYEQNEDNIFEKVSSRVDKSSALFISGKQDFCEEMNNLFRHFDYLKGRARVYVSEPVKKRNTPSEKYTCKVLYRNEVFYIDCFSDETILSAFERNNIPTQAKCKSGECGYCRCKLLEGNAETELCLDIDSRRGADKKYGFIHPCRTFPRSDIIILI